ncbi:MAG: hypothetical protein PWR26_1007 [Methanosarcinales archaeon]|nr:hypothetical protein [Methanosarcinales archaeon]
MKVVRETCPVCKSEIDLELRFKCRTTAHTTPVLEAVIRDIVDVRVQSIGEARNRKARMLEAVISIIRDGMSKYELIRYFMEEHHLNEEYAYGMVEEVKDAFGLYSPDDTHLYYV